MPLRENSNVGDLIHHVHPCCLAVVAAAAAAASGPELDAAIQLGLTAVKLWSVADKPCGSYSGGMRRRLSVAISLMGNPRVVYLDEPSTVRGRAFPLASQSQIGQKARQDKCNVGMGDERHHVPPLLCLHAEG
jgi:ABC-type uncharacterized transport system YnjBCD ATPase subunit